MSHTNVVHEGNYSYFKDSAKFSSVSPLKAKRSSRGDFLFLFGKTSVFRAGVETKVHHGGSCGLCV